MEEQEKQPTDIFLWANKADARKNELDIELFLFNKHYTPFHMPIGASVEKQLKPLFLFDYINFVTLGAGTGLSVRDYEMSESEDNVLLRTELEKVGRAETLIHLIEHERSEIVEFSEVEHEFKRMKGILARFTDKEDPSRVFYTIKLIAQGQVLKSALAWEFADGQFGQFSGEVGFKVPDDNQVLVVDGDIFAADVAALSRGRNVYAEPCSRDLIYIDGGALRQCIDDRVSSSYAFAQVQLCGVHVTRCKRCLRVRFPHRQ